ncbi:hypothetical protein LCGC14_2315390 [marine sediment metagenome]|uniref:HNH nuclease domain-containing protein n=1 Tax=marine sediment metagenome TaxID=412755 RepID=A0A0F9CJG6_9ZZZZ
MDLNKILEKAIKDQIDDIENLESVADRVFYRGQLLIGIFKPVGSRMQNQNCHICGSKDEGTLETHHMDKNSKNNTPSNLITLCANCHRKLHRNLIVIAPRIVD